MVAGKIFAHARETPDRTALIYNHHVLSYGRFASLIDATRRHLGGRGLTGEGVVALAARSLLDAWVLGLALRSLGLTTVAAQQNADLERLDLPNLRAVVATASEPREGLEALCAAHGWPVMRVTDSVFAHIVPREDLPILDTPAGGHIMLTSGTTGRYKKVLIAAADESPLWAQRRANFGLAADSLVNLFDFGGWTGVGYKVASAVWEIGGAVALYQGDERHPALAVPGVTHMMMTPQMLREALAAPDGALRRDDSIALFVTGGALSADLANAAIARLTRRLHTHIGSTETSTFALTPIETAEDLAWHRLLPHCDVQVVDDADQTRPPGEEGLLRVRIDHGATEYLGDTTASGAFFRDGFFYTGDLAVIRADGRLNLHGRVTDVINVDGDKRAAGPVEDQLQRALGVAAVCVLSIPNKRGEEEVHVALEAAGPVDQDLLARALSVALPGVPRARVHTLIALPRNDMGKVQRDVLRRRLLAP